MINIEILDKFPEKQIKEISTYFIKGNFNQINSYLIHESQIKTIDDIYCQQILISISAFCLLKEKKQFLAKDLFSNFNFNDNEAIFPFLFLKAKVNSITGNQSIALSVYNTLLKRYENEKEEEIVQLEAQSQFEYFNYFFNYLFDIRNKESKIIKVTFEVVNILYSFGFNNEAYTILSSLYDKYSKNVYVQFELGKLSILLGNIIEFEKIIEKMKQAQKEIQENNEKLNEVYNIHISFLNMMSSLASSDYNSAFSTLTEISISDPENPIILNNLGILYFLENKIPNTLEQFRKVINTYPDIETTKENMQKITNLLSSAK